MQVDWTGLAEQKNNAAVNYPMKLDMARFSTQGALSDGWGSHYNLGGVLMHHGDTATSGHYTYMHQISSGSWYVRNDNQPQQRVGDPLRQRQAVAGLVYHRSAPPM